MFSGMHKGAKVSLEDWGKEFLSLSSKKFATLICGSLLNCGGPVFFGGNLAM